MSEKHERTTCHLGRCTYVNTEKHTTQSLRKRSQSMWVGLRHGYAHRRLPWGRWRTTGGARNFLSVLHVLGSSHNHICLSVHWQQRPFNRKQKWLTSTVTKFPKPTTWQDFRSASIFEWLSVRLSLVGLVPCCVGITGHTECFKSEDLPKARISLMCY